MAQDAYSAFHEMDADTFSAAEVDFMDRVVSCSLPALVEAMGDEDGWSDVVERAYLLAYTALKFKREFTGFGV